MFTALLTPSSTSSTPPHSVLPPPPHTSTPLHSLLYPLLLLLHLLTSSSTLLSCIFTPHLSTLSTTLSTHPHTVLYPLPPSSTPPSSFFHPPHLPTLNSTSPPLHGTKPVFPASMLLLIKYLVTELFEDFVPKRPSNENSRHYLLFIYLFIPL